MFLDCSPSTWDRVWQRLIGPLPQDAVRPEDDRGCLLGVAVSEAWEEGWPNFDWRGQTYQTQPTVHFVPGRHLLPTASA